MRPVDVEVVGNHIRLRVGQTYMHSEEYDSPSNARRAAKALIKGINERPMRLVIGESVEVVREVWQGSEGPVAVPKGQRGPVSLPFYPQRKMFDPHLESTGQ